MKKVCIVGHSVTYIQAPFFDNEWEIWGLNSRFKDIPRFDRWFDLHALDTLFHEKTEYIQFLQSNASKVWLKENYFGIKGNVFPKEKLMQRFGDFFTCTMAWLIAFAIAEGVTDLALFGIDCSHPTEYIHQRASVLYFLGIAAGRGINIHLPKECELFNKERLYW